MQFERLVDYFERLENTSSRIEMIKILSELLKEASAGEAKKIVYLCQGKVLPDYEGLEIGIGEKFVEEAIATVSGNRKENVEKEYKKEGDLGLVAEKMLAKRKQKSLFSQKLSVDKVYDNLLKIAKSTGQKSQDVKIRLLSELLNSSTPREAKYIIRFPIGTLRLGIGDPTIMDALAEIYWKEHENDEDIKNRIKKEKYKDEEEFGRRVRSLLREKIEAKYNIHPDLGEIADIIKKYGIEGLEKIKIEHGIPIRPTLAERLSSSEDIIKKIGKCAIEAKYDGFRLQIHKKENNVIIFSRRLEKMTQMFPEIVKAVREEIKVKEVIFEGEALAYNENTKEFYPFQITIQRKRKYDIGKMSEEFPLKLFVFDVMFMEGKNVMGMPFKERRKIVEQITKGGKNIVATESIITESPRDIDKYFNECIERGLEGIVAKDLNAPYIAGARKFAWIKLKRSYRGELSDSVDVVIVGYFKGRGLRAKFGLGALLTAVYDKKEDCFKTIAKIGSGFKEEQIEELEKILSEIKIDKKPARVISRIEPDVWVEPKYVIEVVADEITKSPIHTAGMKKEEGLALRFPRMISFRRDKKPEDCTTVEEIERMYINQKVVNLTETEERIDGDLTV
ncbi:MAG: ATP-dependent DNA ligase [Candidatus Diapherotrites archaeon]|nr:ATP-dependent DNA ligase [Candidatus Diapherotrites archaeon]